MAMRHEDDINEQINAAQDSIDEHGGTQWPGMSYEQGVQAGLRWAIGDDETPPMDEE